MRRAFELDVLACPDCGGKLRLLATLTQPKVIRAILKARGLPFESQPPAPARGPPGDGGCWAACVPRDDSHDGPQARCGCTAPSAFMDLRPQGLPNPFIRTAARQL